MIKPEEKKETKNEKMEIEEENKEPTKNVVYENGKIPPIDDFISELSSWKSKLSKFTSSAKFKKTYDFVKKEYDTKTVKFFYLTFKKF